MSKLSCFGRKQKKVGQVDLSAFLRVFPISNTATIRHAVLATRFGLKSNSNMGTAFTAACAVGRLSVKAHYDNNLRC
jgi:hypothetical protein